MNSEERTKRIRMKLKEKRKRRAVLIGTLSAAAALVLTLNLVLFVPYTTGGPPAPQAYLGGEYGALLKELVPLAYDKPYTANNFERWELGFFAKEYGSAGSDMGGMSGTGDPPSAGSDRYREMTDNQKEGVIEGDLAKRTNTHVFYFGTKNSGLVLRSFEIGTEAPLAELPIETGSYYSVDAYSAIREMYLSGDGNTATLIVPVILTKFGKCTAVITVDVSDPATMSQTDVQYLTGDYVSSRMVDGNLLLINNFSVRKNPDLGDKAQYLPSFGRAEGLVPVAMEDIYLPAQVNSAKYTVLASVRGGEIVDTEALLSYSEEVFVSEDNLYVTHEYRKAAAGGIEPSQALTRTTDFTRIAYEGGMFEVGPTKALSGFLNNRYSTDEYEGTFRAVLTDLSGAEQSASLYVLNAETMETVAEVRNFSPKGETVKSARFEGNKLYVCTSAQSLDPVFFFDLSDLENITYKDTGTIPGFSLSLAEFTDGTLAGIGYDENNKLKVELYEETESGVDPLTSFVLDCGFSQDYKAYYIDAARGFIGLGIWDWTSPNASIDPYFYLVLKFDGYKLFETARVEVSGTHGSRGNNFDGMRAFYEDGALHILSDSGYTICELS